MKFVRLLTFLLPTLLLGCNLFLDLTPLPDVSDADLDVSMDVAQEDMQDATDFATDMDFDTDLDMPNPMSWDRIAAGFNHTCALNLEGEVWCWGAGTSGQLGTGIADSITPLKVEIEEAIDSLALGRSFSCGLTRSGAFYCWGSLPGRLANLPPFRVDSEVWSSIKASSDHVCARKDDTLFCLGSNSAGQLGNGIPSESEALPVPVQLDGTLVDYALSEFQTCVLVDNVDRELWCFGGRLDSTTTSEAASRTGRTLITTSEPYATIEGSRNHLCVSTITGVPHCFGRAAHLPDLRLSGDLYAPGPLQQLNALERVRLGTSSGCGFEASGRALCWGGNRRGRLGRGTENTSDDEVQPVAPINYSGQFLDIAMGEQHVCGITDQREIWCWGEHFPSATGLEPGYAFEPQKVMTPLTFSNHAVGLFTNCAVTVTNQVACWGRGYDSLGLNTNLHVETPTEIPGLTVTEIQGAERVYCANTATSLKCWGTNYYGTLGNGTFVASSTPVDVQPNESATHFEVGPNNVCALADIAGEARQYCWGQDDALGVPGTNTSVPVLLEGHEFYKQFAIGSLHACGLTEEGVAYCWGYNSEGQLGNNTATSSVSPVLVSGNHVFKSITAGSGITCGITEDTTYCWGSGVASGGSSTSSSRVPRAIVLPAPLVSINGAYRTVCGVSNVGDVYCWGLNTRGQAGATRSAVVGMPNRVPLPAPAMEVHSSETHTCARLNTGELYCWGDSSFYVLGNGKFGMSTSPEPIRGQ